MLTERVATNAMQVLSFTTACGGALCLIDVVGDLLDTDDLVIATDRRPTEPAAAQVSALVEQLYVGILASTVEDVTQSASLVADPVVSQPDVVAVGVSRGAHVPCMGRWSQLRG